MSSYSIQEFYVAAEYSPLMELKDRILSARKDANLTQADLASAVGVTRGAVAQWENGDVRPRHPAIKKIAAATSVQLDWLITGNSASETSHESDFVSIPEFDVQASAGGGALVDRENVISNWPFAPDFIRDVLNLEVRHLAMIEVRGDSMEPTLSSADKVMINMADKHVQQPGIFVLWDGNGTVVKRVEYMFGTETPKVLLISDNNRHNDYEVEVEQVQIVGRVVWAARRM